MIFYWIARAVRFVSWLFRPPAKRDVGRIQPDAACPVCGARQGTLRCVVMAQAAGSTNGKANAAVFCQHTCSVCGARFYEQPVVKVTPQLIAPSPGRTEQERREDADAAFASQARVQ